MRGIARRSAAGDAQRFLDRRIFRALQLFFHLRNVDLRRCARGRDVRLSRRGLPLSRRRPRPLNPSYRRTRLLDFKVNHGPSRGRVSLLRLVPAWRQPRGHAVPGAFPLFFIYWRRATNPNALLCMLVLYLSTILWEEATSISNRCASLI